VGWPKNKRAAASRTYGQVVALVGGVAVQQVQEKLQRGLRDSPVAALDGHAELAAQQGLKCQFLPWRTR
jgi:hypothetical protein